MNDVGPAAPEILVVDDEPAIGTLLARLLRTQGVRATAVTTAREALHAVEASPGRFALVITDVSMPVMSGTELACALRAAGCAAPVVASTGGDLTLAGTAFASALPKPYTLANITALLRRHLPAVGASS